MVHTLCDSRCLAPVATNILAIVVVVASGDEITFRIVALERERSAGLFRCILEEARIFPSVTETPVRPVLELAEILVVHILREGVRNSGVSALTPEVMNCLFSTS